MKMFTIVVPGWAVDDSGVGMVAVDMPRAGQIKGMGISAGKVVLWVEGSTNDAANKILYFIPPEKEYNPVGKRWVGVVPGNDGLPWHIFEAVGGNPPPTLPKKGNALGNKTNKRKPLI